MKPLREINPLGDEAMTFGADGPVVKTAANAVKDKDMDRRVRELEAKFARLSAYCKMVGGAMGYSQPFPPSVNMYPDGLQLVFHGETAEEAEERWRGRKS